MTRYGTFYSLWVPLGIRSGLWEDFGRFLIDFGPLLGPLGRPFWEPLGTLGQFLDLQTSKMRGFSRPRFSIQFGLHSGRPKNVKMELSCTREHRFQYSRDVHGIDFGLHLEAKREPESQLYSFWGALW